MLEDLHIECDHDAEGGNPRVLVLGSAEFKAEMERVWDTLPEDRQAYARFIHGEAVNVRRLQEGVYEGDVNLGNFLDDVTARHIEQYPHTDAYNEWDTALQNWRKNGQKPEEHPNALGMEPFGGHWISGYGVADNLEQVLAHFDYFVKHPTRRFCIGVVEVVRPENPEPQTGFRWHKWGSYIGIHTPQCEYFNDEEGIPEVMFFHIYEFLPESSETTPGS